MRIFLFTFFVSLFIGVSLYSAIWYTKTYIEPENPLDASIEVGHLENLFAEKVSDITPEGKQEEEWEWEEDAKTQTPSVTELTEGNKRGAPEKKTPTAAKKKKKPKGTPRGKSDTQTHDFGSIDEGDVITHYINVQNRGDAPLRIVDFQVGCGCTMVDYPRKAIQPGKSVKIKAVFDSKDKLGPQNKLVRLVTNGVPKNLDMHFKGYVYPKNFGKTKDDTKDDKEEEKEDAKETKPQTTPKQDSTKKTING